MAALCAALAVTVLPGPPATAATLPTVNQVAAQSQCDLGFGARRWSDKRKALQLMAGRADLGQYGSFRLAADPTWQPVSTLDSSGKGHMHSLHYLLPLLRRGVRANDTAMIDRFYFLLKDWVKDNPPGASTSRYAWGPPIYEGFRSLVLVCAAAGPRGNQPWLVKALQKHGQMEADARRYEGVNNASLHQSMGLYAIAATLGRPAWRRLAVARIQALAVRLIRDDGSDEEGALSYSVNDYTWFGQAAERMRRAGDPVPAELARVAAIPAFIAAATRPDGRLEALGDTTAAPLDPKVWQGTAAEFSATGGTSGTPPPDTFAAYAGGYVFGRSGWGSATRPLADETYYSVRAGLADHVPHAHADQGALTLYSHGSELLYDTGQWRYTYGRTRQNVVSRAAHNVVVVDGVPRSNPRPELRTTRVDGLDLTTVVDRGYTGITITRTIAYDRVEDVMVVWDRLTTATPVRASQQWGLGRDREVSLQGDAASSEGPGANVSMLFAAGGSPLDLQAGRQNPWRGWNSAAYGELSPAPSVRATQTGTSLSWLTVIAPRGEETPASAFTASASVSGVAASVALTTPRGAATVNLDAASGSRVPASAAPGIVPTVSVEEPVVLAGTATTVRGAGLTPGAPVSLEALPVGGTAWTTVATGVATAAGTSTLPITSAPIAAGTDYRFVTATATSGPARLTTAVAPQPPVGVTAVPTGPGQVTVTWQPPADTGGIPLTRYLVRVDGKVAVVPPTGLSTVVSGVLAGPQAVTVRADNALGRSVLAPVTVAVPAYPTVVAPMRVRKGTVVPLQLAGLVPGEAVTVTVTVAPGGAVRTFTAPARADGTAMVRVKLRKTSLVVATSGGVPSAVRRIGVRPR